MGYADGYYYGQTRFIINTDAMSAGDTIRVRSMTDSNKVWNKNVTATGTPLVFDVPCKDYYKICTVQDISDVPTEIGGVYKDGNYGFSYYINVLDKTTLGGIQGILNAHQESSLVAIGDEVTITVNGNPWTMQVANIDTTIHAIDYVSKLIYSMATWGSGGDCVYSSGNACAQADSFYNVIADKDKQYIKLTRKSTGWSRWSSGNAFVDIDKYIWLPKKVEIDGNLINSSDSGSQFPLFITQANRIKTYNGTATDWWTCDGVARESNPRAVYSVLSNGQLDMNGNSNSYGVVPCFRLTADS